MRNRANRTLHRPLIAVLATAALLLSGCSSSDNSSPTGEGSSSAGKGSKERKSSPGDVLTPGQLASALLVQTDLPNGWKLTKNDENDDDDTDFGDSECAQELEKLDDIADPTAEVTRTFNKGKDSLVSIEHNVASYADDKAIGKQFDAIRDALRGCKTLTFSADGQPATLNIGTVRVPEHGDDTFTLRMTGKISLFPFDLMLGVHRVGHNTSSVVYGGLGDASADTFKTAMEAGWAKLEKAHTISPSATPPADTAGTDGASGLRTGGPGTYTATTDDNVLVTVALPVKAGQDPLADKIRKYLDGLGPAYAKATIALVTVTNNSSDSLSAGDLTVVTADGTQHELEGLVSLLNDTDDTHPDAYSREGSDLNDEVSDRTVSDLKPGAKASYLVGINTALTGIKTVYLSVDYDDVQLGLA